MGRVSGVSPAMPAPQRMNQVSEDPWPVWASILVLLAYLGLGGRFKRCTFDAALLTIYGNVPVEKSVDLLYEPRLRRWVQHRASATVGHALNIVLRQTSALFALIGVRNIDGIS